MAKLKTVDQKNKASGDVEIDDSITDTPYHKLVVSEVVRQFLASKQQGTHSTKNRSEVAYSTRKLYRQKGTGSARAGSAKSPPGKSALAVPPSGINKVSPTNAVSSIT